MSNIRLATLFPREISLSGSSVSRFSRAPHRVTRNDRNEDSGRRVNASGLSRRAFAKEKGLTVSTLHWRARSSGSPDAPRRPSQDAIRALPVSMSKRSGVTHRRAQDHVGELKLAAPLDRCGLCGQVLLELRSLC